MAFGTMAARPGEQMLHPKQLRGPGEPEASLGELGSIKLTEKTLLPLPFEFKVQTSFSLLSLSKFCSPFFLPFHSSSPTFKLLSMASYGGEFVLDSSSP
ncbi:hypothetical protein GmHk_19G054485 [Glycine max]|nr:hypothetical protein GmHk_19G054485 [Glycine max]